MRRETPPGFTLVELLLVMVVVGLLGSIAIPRFRSAKENSFEAALQSDLKSLSAQQEIYHNEHFTYTTDPSALGFSASAGVTVAVSAATPTGWGASATHSGTASACAFFYGDAPPVAPAAVAGVLTCN